MIKCFHRVSPPQTVIAVFIVRINYFFEVKPNISIITLIAAHKLFAEVFYFCHSHRSCRNWLLGSFPPLPSMGCLMVFVIHARYCIQFRWDIQLRTTFGFGHNIFTLIYSMEVDPSMCRCGGSLRSSRGGSPVNTSRLSPAVARILCEKCNPPAGDDTVELLVVRKRTPDTSPRVFRRSISGGNVPVKRLSLRRSTSQGDDSLERSSLEHLPSTAFSGRLFRALETIQDTA